jgi:hypothetical protein
MTSIVQLCSCARFEEGGGAGFPRFFAPASDWGERLPSKNTYDKMSLIEGSLEVKLPTIWTHEEQRWEESERREE